MLPNHFSRTEKIQEGQNRLRKYIKRLFIALFFLFLTIITGIVGYTWIAGYTVSEAFYMTIITLSTVGYGEVRPLDTNGQIFTALLIIVNLGIFAYAITVISSFIIEGDFRLFLKNYNVYKEIKKLDNHIIVCGYGRHGFEICEELTNNEQPFVVIEINADKEERATEHNHLLLHGDATDDEVLIEAGIQRAQAIVITFNESAYNVYTVITARELNKKLRIITRASDQKAKKKLLSAGADYAVLSEVIGGFYMATLINQPNVVEFFRILSNMGSETIHFEELKYSDLVQKYRDRPIREMDIRAKTGANIIGLLDDKNQFMVNPRPDEIISRGMALIVLGDKIQVDKFCAEYVNR